MVLIHRSNERFLSELFEHFCLESTSLTSMKYYIYYNSLGRLISLGLFQSNVAQYESRCC